MKRQLRNFFAYRPLPDGREPPPLLPNGEPNKDRIAFQARRYSMAVAHAQKLLGPDAVVFTYESFWDRATWELVETRLYKQRQKSKRNWYCAEVPYADLRYQATSEKQAKRKAQIEFGPSAVVYRCPDPWNRDTWVRIIGE